jgi:DNA-binding phage protein
MKEDVCAAIFLSAPIRDHGRASIWREDHRCANVQTSLAGKKEMDDNNKNRDYLDRDRLLVDEYDEVEHFARDHGVSPSQVRRLIKKNGNDRMTLIQAVRALRDRK